MAVYYGPSSRQVDTGDYDASAGMRKLTPYAQRPRNPNQLSNRQAFRNLGLGVPILGTWFDALFGEDVAPAKSYPKPSPPDIGPRIQRGLGVQPRPPRARVSPDFAMDLFKALNPFQGIMDLVGQMQQGQGRGTDIWQELMQLQDPSRFMPDEGELRRQSKAAAFAQYNPLIRALLQQQQSTESRAEDYDTRLKGIYSDLDRSIKADIPDIHDEYKGSRKELQREYADLEKNISGQYKKSQQEQEAMMQRLNIEAAAPDILPEQQADRDYFINDARAERQRESSALRKEEGADVGYTRDISQVARLTGAERRSDLLGQLEELVQGFESQIGAHRAARGQAIEAGVGDLQSQAMEQAQQQAQQEFQNRMAMLQLERQYGNDEFERLQEMQKGQQGLGAVQHYRDVVPSALEFLQPLGGGPQEAQNVAEALNAVLDNPALQGMVQPNRYQLAQMAMEEGKRRRLGPAQLAALRQIAQEYFG